MKKINLRFVAILFVSFAYFTGCDKNSEDEVMSYVGNFVITNASLAEDLIFNTNEIGQITVSANTPITEVIQTVLLASVTCTSADKSYIELKEDNTIYFSCEGANPLNAGTWEELSETSLKLNLNNTAIPPTGFDLTITDIPFSNKKLSGKTSILLSRNMLAALLAQMSVGLATLDEANTPDSLLVNFVIEFTKK